MFFTTEGVIMYLAKQDGNVYFLREIRLCCQCCRMIDLNITPYLRGYSQGFNLYSHMVCPPVKGTYEERPKLS